MMTREFGMGFLGRNPFDKEARKKFKEEWDQMSDSEKLELMNKRMAGFNHHEDHLSVEAIDARCEAWMKMSNEEKQTFVEERKKAFKSRMHNMHGCFGFGH
ncbi:hypothetical protein [Parabacteroides sp. PF5-9]|uniref:hypothetical protein n=1 Tax=Parabacteroides sp. PF5-9 TaxID=1742404 RepID=UPI00247484A3|nr:hypothetical protein [Parabacteroides sp. PF5-9]MDH6358379.1 ribosomal protein L29 [Parabacteroides sp. PF5-9]